MDYAKLVFVNKLLMFEKKRLGKYYTPPNIARALAGRLGRPVDSILELGTGNGSLALAVTQIFPKSHYFGLDIDATAVSECNSLLSNRTVECCDILSQDGFQRIKQLPTVDAIVGNPPFIQSCLDKDYSELISDIFPSIRIRGRKVRAELIFLASSIFKLRKGGQASFILPSSFFTSDNYLDFRRDVVSLFSNVSVLSLPDSIFSGAEVSTCIFSFKKEKSRQRTISLGQLNKDGSLIDAIKVKKSDAILRMDFAFHKLMSDLEINIKGLDSTLESIGGSVKRGDASRTAIQSKNIKYFHTSCFPKEKSLVHLNQGPVGDFLYAEKGDILTARVGYKCLDRQVAVASGKQAITDCVYRIRVDEENIESVMNTLSGSFGIAWRKLHARGSCAKFITKDSLLQMPLL